MAETGYIVKKEHIRADSAQAVVEEILPIAKADMKGANALDNDVAEDDPVKPVLSEHYWKRRALVDSLRDFLASSRGRTG